MAAAMRTFEDTESKPGRVPLCVGLCGPSGSGKTYSALRLATGIQRVTGGDIFVIDTESRRAMHYARFFKFRHIDFGAPFSPLDYLAAIEHAVKKGAKIIVVDSMSHEHAGSGGVLEWHEAEVQRMAGDDYRKAEKVKMSAWIKPKAARQKLINTVLQLPISSIFCFRAKEKIKIVTGKDPQPLGYMPIAGEEFVFEMTLACLLLPRADGVPTWQSEEVGERATMKLPAQFRELFAARAPLSEDIGERLAQWAEGGDATTSKLAADLLAEVDLATDLSDESPTLKKLSASKGKLSKAEIVALSTAVKARKAALAAPKPEPGTVVESVPKSSPKPAETVNDETGEVTDTPPTREPGDES